MVDELRLALHETPNGDIRNWGMWTAKTLGRVTARRVRNFGRLLLTVGRGIGSEAKMSYRAFRQETLKTHLVERANAAKGAAASASADVTAAVQNIARAVRENPAENAPTLIVATLAFLLASGGTDGDGGVPDLDLVAGIDAHRSIFTHSIISGAIIETMLLSSAAFVGIVYTRLPTAHDPMWDAIAKHRDRYVKSAAQGMSLGIAYHLFVDGMVEPAAYHDLPGSYPIEVHETIIDANAVAEGIDTKHKGENHHG